MKIILVFIAILSSLAQMSYASPKTTFDGAYLLGRLRDSDIAGITKVDLYEADRLIVQYIRESDSGDFRAPSSERLDRLKRVQELFDEKIVSSLLQYAGNEKSGGPDAVYLLRFAAGGDHLQKNLEEFILQRSNYRSMGIAARIMKTKGILSSKIVAAFNEEIIDFKNFDFDPFVTEVLANGEYWADGTTVPQLVHVLSKYKSRYSLDGLFVLGMAAKLVPSIGGRESAPLLEYFEAALRDPTYLASNEKSALDSISAAVDFIVNNRVPAPVYGLDGSGYLNAHPQLAIAGSVNEGISIKESTQLAPPQAVASKKSTGFALFAVFVLLIGVWFVVKRYVKKS